MFEQFSIYPEIKWRATAVAEYIGTGGKIQINPDLENFKLERFRDFRSHPEKNEPKSFKLMLVGSSKTNIFIDGPDHLLDILITKLPRYIGKSWFEINKITLERSCINCNNFLKANYCNSWIIDKFGFKEKKPGGNVSYFNTNDLLKADEICAKCDNFAER